MIAISTPAVVSETAEIPYVTAEEAFALMQTSLERMIRLLETLAPEDWSKPTACTAWNVRDMVAHQAGGYASGTGYGEMVRQYSSNPKRGQLPEDAVNELQVSERKSKTPAELIAELKQAGSVAIQKWAYQFRVAKLLSIPHPVPGILSLRHLMWVIHSRDTWMHRLDICRATGKPFEQTAEHDRRIAALVMRDVVSVLARKSNGATLVFELTGIADGTWKVGRGEPVAAIRMDVLDFNIFASGRYSYEQARPMMTITGNEGAAEKALKQIIVLY